MHRLPADSRQIDKAASEQRSSTRSKVGTCGGGIIQHSSAQSSYSKSPSKAFASRKSTVSNPSVNLS